MGGGVALGWLEVEVEARRIERDSLEAISIIGFRAARLLCNPNPGQQSVSDADALHVIFTRMRA